jgi:hypothetical protein
MVMLQLQQLVVQPGKNIQLQNVTWEKFEASDGYRSIERWDRV